MEENNIVNVDEMTRKMNYGLHAEQLDVPILNIVELVENNNPQAIITAVGNGYMEQLVSDGYIEDGTFNQRIELVIDNTKKYMKQNGYENVDNSFIYYKDYNNGVFTFKIYVCDMIINNGTSKSVIRQFNAYFVEPKMKDFYQFSLATGPFNMPTEILKVGTIDLENDIVTQSLDDLMMMLLENIKYREEENVDKDFQEYCRLYEEKFGKHAYIAEPDGTKEQTIEAIKICLEKNEDLLDALLYPNNSEVGNDNILY